MWTIVVLAFLSFLLTRAIWRRWKYDLHKIPCPPGLPILGNVLSLARNEGEGELTQFRGRWWNELGHPKLFRLDIIGISLVEVRDAEVTKSLFATQSPPLEKSLAIAKHVYMLVGNNPNVSALFMCSKLTPYAKGIRKVYARWLQSHNLKRLFPKVNNVISKMVKIVDEQKSKGPIDFQELSVKMIIDAIGIAAFDVNLGGLDNSRELYDLLIEGGHVIREFGFNPIKAFVHKWYPDSPLVQNQANAINRLTREWDTLMIEMMKREKCQQSASDFWYQLKNFIDPETNKPLSYEYLLAECASIVLGGMDSTGHQLSWILALLASNPHVTSKLINELTTSGLYGPGARDICFEDLSDLTYLTAVVKEGMRLASVFPGSLFRIIPEDMTILGHRIPKGTLITAPGNRWMDSEDEWKDPLRFRPERWLEEDTKSKYFFGFSFGQRDCPGQKLAMLDMRLAIIQLVKKYELTLTVPYEELCTNTRLGVVVEATDGIWIQVKPRDTPAVRG